MRCDALPPLSEGKRSRSTVPNENTPRRSLARLQGLEAAGLMPAGCMMQRIVVGAIRVTISPRIKRTSELWAVGRSGRGWYLAVADAILKVVRQAPWRPWLWNVTVSNGVVDLWGITETSTENESDRCRGRDTLVCEVLNDPTSFAPIRGLREADVQARLKTEGYNELPRSERRTPLRIVLEVLREPMLALLLGGGAIYLALGDLKDALILLAFATMSVLITVVQETRTERVLEALRDLTSPRALVIRDGERKRVAGREVVRGDFIVLAEGDRVPADALLVAKSRPQDR